VAQPAIVGKIAIKIMPDTSTFRSDARAELRVIEAALRSIKVRLELDKQHLNMLTRDLLKWANDLSPLRVDVRPVLVTGSTTLIRSRLQTLTRPRTVEIIPKIQKAGYAQVATALAALSGARLTFNWLDNFRDLLSNLDKSLPLIGSVALAVAGLSGWLLAASTNLAAMSAELARIFPLLLAAPGVLVGIGLGLGASVAVLKDFNAVLPGVGAQFRALQDAMSAAFWTGALAPFHLFIETLFPQFAAGMTAVSAQLGLLYGQLATAMTASLDGALPAMFADLSASIAVAATGTSAWAEAVRVLGETGAGYLPALAGWFVDISTRFANFLVAAQADGSLQGWIDRAIANLGSLGTGLAGIGSIFAGIAQAAEAAGAASLASFAQQMTNIANVVNSPAFQQGLTGVLTAASNAMSLIVAGSGAQFSNFIVQLGQTMQTILPLAGQAIGTLVGTLSNALASPAFQGGLVDFFTGLNAGIAALSSAFGPLALAAGPLLGLLGTFAEGAGPLLGSVFTTAAVALQALLPGLEPLVSLLTGELLNAFTLVVPLVTAVAAAAGQLLAAVLPLLAPLYELANVILGVIVQVATDLLSAVLPPLLELVRQAVEAATPILSLLSGLIALLEPVLVPILVFIGEIVASSLIGLFSGIVSVVSGAFDVIMGLWTIFKGLFTGDWSLAWEGVKQVFSGVLDILKGLWDILWNVGILGIFGKGAKLLSGLWKKLWDWARDLFKGWKDKLLDFALDLYIKLRIKWEELKERAKLLFGQLRDQVLERVANFKQQAVVYFGRLKDEAVEKARQIRDDVKAKISEMASKAVDLIKDLPGKAKEGLGNLKTKLVGVGKDLVQGFIDGIGDMFDSVKSTLTDLTSKLGDWKGPPEKDRWLLYDAGRLVVDGFRRGLESRYASIRASLAAFSADIGNTVIAAPRISDVAARTALLVDQAAADPSAAGTRVLNYYAAPQQSLSSEEALFTAANRSVRMGW
jgi:phage-related protein